MFTYSSNNAWQHHAGWNRQEVLEVKVVHWTYYSLPTQDMLLPVVTQLPYTLKWHNLFAFLFTTHVRLALGEPDNQRVLLGPWNGELLNLFEILYPGVNNSKYSWEKHQSNLLAGNVNNTFIVLVYQTNHNLVAEKSTTNRVWAQQQGGANHNKPITLCTELGSPQNNCR